MVFENIIYFTWYSNKKENIFASKKSTLNVPNLNISQYVHWLWFTDILFNSKTENVSDIDTQKPGCAKMWSNSVIYYWW